MRYCMNFFLKGHQNGQRLKFWQFWCPLKKKFMQYLIWTLSLVVRNHKVGKGMAALLHSTTPSWKVSICFIKRQKSGFREQSCSLDYKPTTDPRMGVMCISPFFSRSRRYAKKLSPARLAPEKKGLYLRIYYIKDPFHFSVRRVEHWKLKVEYENCVTDSFCILLPNFACDCIGPI